MGWRTRAAEFSVKLVLAGDDWPNHRFADGGLMLAALRAAGAWASKLGGDLLRLGLQREEAHHVMREREPKQMDAGLDLAAQG
jgi:hypothetical protein